MKLRYRLTGIGWSKTMIEEDHCALTLRASYLSDAFGQLARGAIAVFRGSEEVRFSFDDEPGEYRWILKKKDAQTYTLTIIEFPELWGNKPDNAGTIIFERNVLRVEFAKGVLKALEDVRHEHSEEDYKDMWVEHDFPTKELTELHSCIDAEKG